MGGGSPECGQPEFQENSGNFGEGAGQAPVDYRLDEPEADEALRAEAEDLNQDGNGDAKSGEHRADHDHVADRLCPSCSKCHNANRHRPPHATNFDDDKLDSDEF